LPSNARSPRAKTSFANQNIANTGRTDILSRIAIHWHIEAAAGHRPAARPGTSMTKIKRMNTRDQILARLSLSGWERTGIDDDTDWWVDEHWTIRSVRQNFGLTLVISFLVDPMYEGNNKGPAVWQIVAGTRVPVDRFDSEKQIAELTMMKGRFDKNLKAFVATIDHFRDGPHQRDGDGEISISD
jgi:hypothetical protein